MKSSREVSRNPRRPIIPFTKEIGTMALALTAAVGSIGIVEGVASGIANQPQRCEVIAANPFTWAICPIESGTNAAIAELLHNEPHAPKSQS